MMHGHKSLKLNDWVGNQRAVAWKPGCWALHRPWPI